MFILHVLHLLSSFSQFLAISILFSVSLKLAFFFFFFFLKKSPISEHQMREADFADFVQSPKPLHGPVSPSALP